MNDSANFSARPDRRPHKPRSQNFQGGRRDGAFQHRGRPAPRRDRPGSGPRRERPASREPSPAQRMRGLWKVKNHIVVVCAAGLTAEAEKELQALGYPLLDSSDSFLLTRGTMCDVMRLNLWLRSAQRVLWPLQTLRAANLQHLYDAVYELPWEEVLDAHGRFSVSANVRDVATIRDSRMPALKTKDAIADRFRRARGSRPDSDNRFEGASIYIYWRDNDLRICLDTSGDSLSRRGYRLQPGPAPMQEALAAGCIMATGWDAATPFVVPMCGSGTPAIEAAMIACRRAPGIFRSHYAFMALKDFGDKDDAAQTRRKISRGQWLPQADGTLLPAAGAPPVGYVKPSSTWTALVAHARENELTGGWPEIVASDINPDVVHDAEANAGMAGVREMIRFEICDFAETTLPEESGIMFVTPEYGDRLGDPAELVPLYERLGHFIRQQCSGWRTFVLAGNRELSLKIDLKSSSRRTVYNGPIECRLLEFESWPKEPESEE